MNELNDRLKPALDWCKRRELERLSASIAKGGGGGLPDFFSSYIYPTPCPKRYTQRKI